MAVRSAYDDYELTLKILAAMECSKPIALVAISQSTGIKLADIIRYSARLIKENIIERAVDNGNIFYTLLTDEYEKKLRAVFELPEEEDARVAKHFDSRDAVMMRRAALRSSDTREKSSDVRKNVSKSSTDLNKLRHPNKPERLSALDLLAMKRSSASLSHVNDPARSAVRIPALQSSAFNPRQSRESDALRNSSTSLLAQSGAHPSVDRRSSTTHKAVYINKPTRRSEPRSTFMPPASLDNSDFERSDGTFKMNNPDAGRMQVPIIPENALTSSNSEIPDDEVRKCLEIHHAMPLISILSPRPCHQVWSSCSALANSGGGYIILGLRKYEKDGVVTYYIKSVNNPEEAIKNILKNFNDRNIISDKPKDSSFIYTAQLHKKNVIVMRIDPAMFSPAPLFTTRDSFGMKTNQGCYLYVDDQIIHCTEDDVKSLWKQRRLGNDLPDWNQSSPQANVELQRKVSVHMPVQIDDAVRPLSRKTSNYMQPVEQPKLIKDRPRHRSSEDEMYEGERILATTGFLKSVEPPMPLANAYPRREENQPMPSKMRRDRDHAVSDNTVENLLFAEDFRIPSKAHVSTKFDNDIASSQKSLNFGDISDNTQIDVPQNEYQEEYEANLPPLFEDADLDELTQIVQPVIDHPRLPMTRVCELAVSLCTKARFTISELAQILNKKPTPIKEKVMPKLRENPNFTEYKGTFYIKK